MPICDYCGSDETLLRLNESSSDTRERLSVCSDCFSSGVKKCSCGLHDSTDSVGECEHEDCRDGTHCSHCRDWTDQPYCRDHAVDPDAGDRAQEDAGDIAREDAHYARR